MSKSTKLVPVIVSGGSGTRLWPMSRTHYPKQFALEVQDQCLFSLSLDRVAQLDCQRVVVVCNKAHRFFALEQLQESSVTNYRLLLEPLARNTAPALALAMESCHDLDDPLLLFIPSDQLIGDPEDFVRQIQCATEHAQKGAFVTFGVTPNRPETGYGYIIAAASEAEGAYPVESFQEKPNLAQAQAYLERSDCYWNSGIFMCRSSVYRDALQQHATDILKTCHEAWEQRETDHIVETDVVVFKEEIFARNPDISIDYAVVEKLSNAVVVPLASSWSDLGAWEAMSQVFPQDDDGNYVQGDAVLYDAHDNIVYSSHRLVTLCGVDKHIVAETPDAILIADRTQGQSVKALVKTLREQGYPQSDWHRKVYRPWGSYESIDSGDGFQVKRLIVNPGQRLSLQRHQQRSEHWVVVKGTATVTINDEVSELQRNQSVCIPIGSKHCLENTTADPVWLIEVQCGSYLGEDDIERFDDVYGRSTKDQSV